MAEAFVAADVTVVIPTFNRAGDLMRTLAALHAQEGGTPRVIVVDNSSQDDTAARVQALLAAWNGRLRYERKPPQGPASARNRGLTLADTPLVLFLDSDVELPPAWLRLALSRLATDDHLAAVGGYVLYAFEPARVNAYGGDLGHMGLAWDQDEGSLLDESRGPAERIWINCSAMLARAAAVSEVGAFDEDFFYGYEDSDLGWRLRLAGHRVAVFPELRAIHHVENDAGTAHPQIVFHAGKNRLRSLLRNASAASLWPRLAAYLAYVAVDLVLRGPRGPKWAALRWNFAQRAATARLRRLTQATRRCSDAEVFAHGAGRLFPPVPLGNRRRRTSRAGPDASAARPSPRLDDRV